MKKLSRVLVEAITNRLNGGLPVDKYIGHHVKDKRQKAKLLDEYRMYVNGLSCKKDECCKETLPLPTDLQGEYDITIISETPYPDVCSVGPVANILGIDKGLVEQVGDNETVAIRDCDPQMILHKAVLELTGHGVVGFDMDEEDLHATLVIAYA